eukprot:scaffold868_cov351-Pavlova_lutheri.AAC.9
MVRQGSHRCLNHSKTYCGKVQPSKPRHTWAKWLRRTVFSLKSLLNGPGQCVRSNAETNRM